MSPWTAASCMSSQGAQKRCWIAGKQLVSVVIMRDVMSTMDVKIAFAMELRRSGVFPVESRIDEPFA